ncbi:MAG TPA: TonB-dependent receptor [Tenuifilaceae bacterium]|nr:TonB-dependent receptor [Tenuifilaceae bacterium]HPN20281.1 TonB-dependent receptor [Tenuifilaceae bacterium]
MKTIYSIFLLSLLMPFALLSQETGIIKGKVFDKQSNEPVPFANIIIFGTTIGTTSDFEGNYLFTGLKPGYIEIQASAIGFKPYISEAILVTNAKTVFVDLPIEQAPVELEGVVVKASTFRRSDDAPVSLRRIGIDEIEKNPGGNRDISKVIQSLPGVASSVSYRNDVIVRGGGPNENRFYLDGIEIPNLNHFATQGASGGPVGIINVDFVREVNFYSGAFPANFGNAMSSILDFRQIDGNKDKLKVKAAIGASDLALTLDGPISNNTSFIFSARRSYLQFLFNALGLPFLPTYNDFQFKTKTKFDSKNELTIIGLGAIDDFELNTGLKNPDESQRYILGYLPVNTQWNYTIGASYKHFKKNGFETYVISRNMLNNRQYKYQSNDESQPKLLDYKSWEAENKFRYERQLKVWSNYDLNFGGGMEYARYFNSTFRAKYVGETYQPDNYETNMDMFKWSLFGQINHTYFQKLTLSLGLRADANNYSTNMSNLFKQISPRISASYEITPEYYLNFNVGRFYQQPSYTTLGFSNAAGDLVNKSNGLKYIRSDHFVFGAEWLPNESSRLSVEGFLKLYNNYPVSLIDSVSIASKGAGYGTFGDEPVKSVGKGRAYGAEFLYRNKNLLGFNTLISYTLVRSESAKMDENLNPTSGFIPTSWDNEHLISITATRTFKRGWDVGFKWRFVGGAPYTPYDLQTSALIDVWNTRNQAVLDYGKFNTLRLNGFHQLDVRVDKMYYFNNWTLNLYVDVQNIYNFKGEEADNYVTEVDINGNPTVNPDDPTRYLLKKLKNDGSGTILPTIGIIVEF